MKKIIPELMTERVLLRKMSHDLDLTELYKIMKNSKVHKWTGGSVPSNILETMEEMDKLMGSEEIILWSVIGRDVKKAIGYYWIMKPIENMNKIIIPAEMQKIGEKYWRKGYTRDARKLVYEYCFNQLDADIIYAQAWEDNINSCRSMEHAGFVCYDKENKKIEMLEENYNECSYILTKHLWENSSLIMNK